MAGREKRFLKFDGEKEELEEGKTEELWQLNVLANPWAVLGRRIR